MEWKDLSHKADALLQRLKGAVRRRRTLGTGVPVSRAGSPAGEPLDAAEHAPPPVDLLEGAGELLIIADVPGAVPRRTEVTWDGERGLTLHAWGPDLGEDASGVHWLRTFTLPGGFDGGRASATLQRGILTVRVPRDPALTSRAVPVRAGV